MKITVEEAKELLFWFTVYEGELVPEQQALELKRKLLRFVNIDEYVKGKLKTEV